MEKWYPLPYSGVPGALSALSMVLFAVSLPLQIYGQNYFTLGLVLFWIGWLMALASAGRNVTISEGRVTLTYGFPFRVFKLVVDGVVEMADLNSLQRGKLFKYFKVQVIPYAVVTFYPLLYVAAKFSLPPIYFLAFLLIPSAVGLSLLMYFMLTFASYRRFIKYAGYTVVSTTIIANFGIASYYNAAFGKPITSDAHALILLILGELLIFLAFALYASLATKRHVILLEDTRGKHYAIGAVDEDAAKELTRKIVEEVMMRDA
ncbi:MAG: hypothetical protein DRJ55_05390 [Thermoprotei archaeon]|nr:MAG: hypothetical protein DRJ55_05390 [Thermoprotei archaeon]